MKKTIALLFFFMVLAAYPQKKNLLIQNVNLDARELYHRLNDTRDSILLECMDAPIIKVGLYKSADDKGEAYNKYFYPGSTKAAIPLENLPKGRYAVSVYINRKIIMITMLVVEDMSKSLKTAGIISLDVEDISPPIRLSLKPTVYEIPRDSAAPAAQFNLSSPLKPLTVISTASTNHIKTSYVEKAPDPIPEREVEYDDLSIILDKPIRSGYWVISVTRSSFGSHSTNMMVFDKQDVDALINKNINDLKSYSGKYNRLIIWEVYDVDRFLGESKKIGDKVVYPKDTFNKVPIYPEK